MSDMMMRLVSEQRKRCLGAVLGSAESSPWWKRLTREEQIAYRQRVIDSVGTFYDFVRDVVKVGDDDMLRNEHALELLERIHTQVSERRTSEVR